jgi:hypothetical protein
MPEGSKCIIGITVAELPLLTFAYYLSVEDYSPRDLIASRSAPPLS